MAHINVKILDVLHDPHPNPQLSKSELETRIRRNIPGQMVVKDVHVNLRTQNSPITIELEASNITPNTIKRDAEQAVREFANHVDGVDVDNTVRDDNIIIENVDE